MTHSIASRRGPNRIVSSIVDHEAPPQRLALFRILLGTFVVGYLVIRLPVFLELRHRDEAGFEGQGIFAAVDRTLPDGGLLALIALALIAGVGFATGVAWRVSGPLFAVAVLVLSSYRSSWGQLLHFEHLFVLHLVVVGLSPAADACAVRARARRSISRAPTAYGWPLRLCALIVVITYVIAGIAKLRYGGTGWIVGDTLRNHVAYAAARLDLLGEVPSPLARPLLALPWALPPLAAATVVIELSAPIALLGGRWRNLWVAAAWLMHVGILTTMLIGFPYPLSLIAFAPFYEIEKAIDRLRTLGRASGPPVTTWAEA